MAFLLDDILLFPLKAPVAGFRWILRQVQTMADEQLLDDQPWKERLIELQMMLEIGDIDEAEYTRQEAEVFQALRDIRARREQIARDARGDDEESDIGIYTGYGK
jgi:Gas vesicle protein G